MMKKQYEKPSITRSIIILGEQSFLKASVKSTDLGVTEGQSFTSDQVELHDDHYDAWGDVKAQHSWGDDPF